MPNATGSVQRERASLAAFTTSDGLMCCQVFSSLVPIVRVACPACGGRAHRIDFVVQPGQGWPIACPRRDNSVANRGTLGVAERDRERRLQPLTQIRRRHQPAGGHRALEAVGVCERADRKQAVAEMQQGQAVVAHVSASWWPGACETGVNGRTSRVNGMAW